MNSHGMVQNRCPSCLPAGRRSLSWAPGSVYSHGKKCLGIAAAGQVPHEGKPATFLLIFLIHGKHTQLRESEGIL